MPETRREREMEEGMIEQAEHIHSDVVNSMRNEGVRELHESWAKKCDNL
jgi:hypothetical protein